MVIITRHADNRLRKRLNLKRKSHQHHIELVLKKGIRHAELAGQIKRFIDKRVMVDTADTLIVYNYYVYCFIKQTEVLLTVFELPKELKSKYESIKRKHEEAINHGTI